MSNLAEAIKDKPSYPPMLQQYIDYKGRYPDCLLFFQVGDFYELFFEDAVTVSKAINLTLTSRDKGRENPIPMCGVPISVADLYCDRLVDQGFSVAIVSQQEPPSGEAISAKNPVIRKLERIITPAVKVLASADASAAVGCVAALSLRSEKECAIAYTDVQSGQIFVKEGFSVEELPHVIQSIAVGELVIQSILQSKQIDRRLSWIRSTEHHVVNKNIKFRVPIRDSQSRAKELEGYSALSPLSKITTSFLCSYLDEVTVEAIIPFKKVSIASYENSLLIDPTTRDSLELIKNSRDGSERGTLFEYLNFTKTLGGARFLRKQLISPLSDSSQILNRYKYLENLLKDESILEELEAILNLAPDIERIAARIDLKIVTPKEVGALRDFFISIPNFLKILKNQPLLELLTSDLYKICCSLGANLNSAIVDEPPLTMQEGSIFRKEFNEELAELLSIQSDSKSWLSDLEQKERARTGISSLKIKYTSVFGFFIEVSNSQLSKVPPDYTRKQTTANAERFIILDLKNKEEIILGADNKRIRLERTLFEQLRLSLISHVESLRQIHEVISFIDFISSLTRAAITYRLTKPEICEDPILDITDGKHPQVSKILRENFIANNTYLDSNKISTLVLTGPNMGGKSTYLRQVALITILTHIGSYVPAKKAVIGLVDKIFARIGASDNIQEGESTFMVEMREAAQIIQCASSKSLLIIDEIGRGTATKDGLAIAQSILEWIFMKIQARCVFATHFHELTELEGRSCGRLKNISTGSVEVGHEVVFTHKIVEGPATKSFGIEVAKLAGLPQVLINRAEKLLSQNSQIKTEDLTNQLSLFSDQSRLESTNQIFEEVKSDLNPNIYKIFDKISQIDPDLLTPRDALLTIWELSDLAK